MTRKTALTTSDRAILSLIALKPWSAYDLAKYMMRSNLRILWPQAESQLYEIPKRLAKGGYVSVKSEGPKGRPRAVYRITPKGRAALKTWLSEPVTALSFQSEIGLKVAAATEGSVDDLRETLRLVRRILTKVTVAYIPVAEELFSGGATLPERAHVTPIVGEMVRAMAQGLMEWSYWAEAYVADWEDTQPSEAKVARSVALGRAWIEKMRAQLESNAKHDPVVAEALKEARGDAMVPKAASPKAPKVRVRKAT